MVDDAANHRTAELHQQLADKTRECESFRGKLAKAAGKLVVSADRIAELETALEELSDEDMLQCACGRPYRRCTQAERRVLDACADIKTLTLQAWVDFPICSHGVSVLAVAELALRAEARKEKSE